MAYRDTDPTILIFGDTEDGMAIAHAAALSHGARIAAAFPVADAVDEIDRQTSVDLVIVDVIADHGPVLDHLFGRILNGATSNRFVSIVALPPELVDLTAAHIEHEGVSILVGRDAEALHDVLARRLAHAQPLLREPGPELGPMPVSDVPGGVRDRTDGETGALTTAADFIDMPERAMTWADGLRDFDPAVIRSIVRARRLRNEVFGMRLFADPAWDILLDLMVARSERRSVAVSSLCIAAAVPATTALRWIKQLTEQGLLRRVADSQDGRRVFIELTETAIGKLTAYVDALVGGRGTESASPTARP